MCSDYNGPREADGIVKYMKSKSGQASRELLTAADVEKFLAADEHCVVGFFTNRPTALSPTTSRRSPTLSPRLTASLTPPTPTSSPNTNTASAFLIPHFLCFSTCFFYFNLICNWIVRSWSISHHKQAGQALVDRERVQRQCGRVRYQTIHLQRAARSCRPPHHGQRHRPLQRRWRILVSVLFFILLFILVFEKKNMIKKNNGVIMKCWGSWEVRSRSRHRQPDAVHGSPSRCRPTTPTLSE